MKILNDEELCTGCSACAACCPSNAISMCADVEGFLRPVIDQVRCCECGKCQRTCPINYHVIREDGRRQIRAFAVAAADDAILASSSSGGVFTLLAEYVLRADGVVFGAAFSDDFKSVSHIAVKHRADLWKLQGSKYLQSELGTSYEEVGALLRENRLVCFSGTPCQVAGLRAWLGGDNPNLITVDVLCHGVPSPGVWSAYLSSVLRGRKEKLSGISFRDKSNGWSEFCIKMDFQSGRRMLRKQKQDLYFRAFLSNLTLRKSCYRCQYKGTDDCSDISLGDFWGIGKINPLLNDERGVSLVVIRSGKAQQIWDNIACRLRFCEEVSLQEAGRYNTAMNHSVRPAPGREAFFKDCVQADILKSLARYAPLTPKERIRLLIPSRLKRALKKTLGRG